jgi:uncharacterized repeat protein (TIGR03847 family)
VELDLGPVDRITADAVGPPGHRTFFIQGRVGDRIVSVLVEKQQVQLLAASVVEILAQIGKPTGDGPSEEAMALDEPVMPEWRAGRLAISYLQDDDMLVLEVEELTPDSEDEDDEDDPDDEEPDDEPGLGLEGLADGTDDEVADGDGAERGVIRFWATREQMLALARHAAQVCSAGRPTCRFCDQPIDAEGHVCPAMNGHRTTDG